MIRLAALCVLSLCAVTLRAQEGVPDDLKTIAERSSFKATARHAQVVKLMDRIAERSDLANRFDIGRTSEDRSIPALVIADPPVTTPKEAAEQVAKDGKMVVLLFGNIHAGEVCGKEALLMLARELALMEDHPLLDDLIVVVVPIYNADGNERMKEGNRPGQVGPEKGMGQRANAMGLDLNRDFIKMEAPETHALIRAINQWDPTIVVDTHTTNGSLHRNLVTYAGPKVAAGDDGLRAFVRDTMMPRISASLEDERAMHTFFYGNFDSKHENWRSFPDQARFGTSYIGLGNRIGILSEAYAYASFEERVRGTLAFCTAILRDAAANKGMVVGQVNGARARTRAAGMNPSAEDMVAIRTRPAPSPDKAIVKGFVEEKREGRRVSTGQAKDYEVTVWDRHEVIAEVRRPFAYTYPSDLAWLTELLQRHGVEVEEFREDLEVDVETYTLTKIERAERAFQGHKIVAVDVAAEEGSQRINAGTMLVRTGQDLGNLIVYLLEPMCDDGLVAWNFFDDHMEEGNVFPVGRIVEPTRITSGAVRPLAEDREMGKRVTWKARFEDRSLPNFSGNPVRISTWTDDDHFVLSQGGKRWEVEARTGRSTLYEPTGDMAGALAKLATISKRDAQRLGASAARTWNPDQPGTLVLHENDLYFCTWDGEHAVRLTSTPGREELYSLSPDGAFAAFVRENDLYVVEIATQTERALTQGGTDLIRSGKAGWVYFEEVFGRNWRTYWWSPDSTRIAFLESDSTDVPGFVVTNNRDQKQVVEMTRYPKPGEANPKVRLGLVSVAGGNVGWVDATGFGTDHLITGVGFYPDSSAAYFYVQDRAQTWLDVNTVGVRGGKPTRLLRDTTEAWVQSPGSLTFLEDGSFLMSSERTGWKHWYRYQADGTLVGPITEGEWEARRLVRVDEERGWVYFSGAEGSFTGSDLYRAKLDGSHLERLTSGKGSHRVSLSPGCELFVDSWSDFSTPTRVVLRELEASGMVGKKGASVARVLDTNPVYALEEYTLSAIEHVEIKAKDGFPLEAIVVKPTDFDPRRSYPVWFMTYAGPHAPTVRDAWSGGRVNDQMLAEMGYVVFRSDPRSASGKGAVSAWTAYEKLGVPEMADIADAIGWITSHKWADGRRVGMSGHSYGGFMTSYALTHSDLFAAGIAGAPVTDWRDYDTIYTERYMNTPAANPDGYAGTSVVAAGKDVHGRLLILHGEIDDNVHMQNSMRLARALQQADKPFEMMVYPGFRHGIGGMHYQKLLLDFMDRMIGVEKQ
jgi:dipeptidyl-peptidase 4